MLLYLHVIDKTKKYQFTKNVRKNSFMLEQTVDVVIFEDILS